MGLMETSLMRQLGKLVEVVRHANEVLGDGYRLCVVSADHLAVQGELTNVLRQLAIKQESDAYLGSTWQVFCQLLSSSLSGTAFRGNDR